MTIVSSAWRRRDFCLTLGLGITIGGIVSHIIFANVANKELIQFSSPGPRILCWVMTSPSHHSSKDIHIKATWGKRCDKLIFMSTQADVNLPAVNLNITEGRGNLWEKTKEAFKYIYDKHLLDADWFLKVDDDTYIVVDNLRSFLHSHSPAEPVYFGCKLKPFVEQGYMSGGAGYVLSKEALIRFITTGLADTTGAICNSGKESKEHEDYEMGSCLQKLSVNAGDSRDQFGRDRFFPIGAEDLLMPRKMDPTRWYWKYISNPFVQGPDCCSDSLISLHYVKPEQMYAIDYFIYRVGRNLPRMQ